MMVFVSMLCLPKQSEERVEEIGWKVVDQICEPRSCLNAISLERARHVPGAVRHFALGALDTSMKVTKVDTYKLVQILR
jgi:hypothetical protein